MIRQTIEDYPDMGSMEDQKKSIGLSDHHFEDSEEAFNLQRSQSNLSSPISKQYARLIRKQSQNRLMHQSNASLDESRNLRIHNNFSSQDKNERREARPKIKGGGFEDHLSHLVSLKDTVSYANTRNFKKEKMQKYYKFGIPPEEAHNLPGNMNLLQLNAQPKEDPPSGLLSLFTCSRDDS